MLSARRMRPALRPPARLWGVQVRTASDGIQGLKALKIGIDELNIAEMIQYDGSVEAGPAKANHDIAVFLVTMAFWSILKMIREISDPLHGAHDVISADARALCHASPHHDAGLPHRTYDRLVWRWVEQRILDGDECIDLRNHGHRHAHVGFVRDGHGVPFGRGQWRVLHAGGEWGVLSKRDLVVDR